MDTTFEKLEKFGVIPVIALDDPDDALPLAAALTDGGLSCAEVTFRTAAAEESIRRIAAAYPDMLVGAVTVLTTQQVDRAVAAGAKFIVSPGLNPNVVRHCLEKGVPAAPGCCTPSEIEQAIELGLSVVKFFPAEAMGGLKTIKALAAPYTGLRFMPTGGINASNLRSYLEYPRVLACGGSWMVSKELIRAHDFAQITELVRQATAIVRESRG